MTKEDIKYQAYIQILKEELIPAMGCTEPIALAYAAAKAREVLGCIPERVHIGASGSIIKNVKSVIVPNTNHLKGIPAAATAGIIAGDASKELEVISDVTEAQTKEMAKYLEETEITVEHIDNGCIFDIIVEVFAGKDSAKVRIANYHTNIVRIEKNGKILHYVPVEGASEDGLTDRTLLVTIIQKCHCNLQITISVKSWPVRLSITAQSPMKDSPEITVQILELYFLILTATTSAHAQKLALLPDLMRE